MSLYRKCVECDGPVNPYGGECVCEKCDGSVDHLSLINSPDVRESLARVAKNACEDALTRQVEAELLHTMAMQSRRAA